MPLALASLRNYQKYNRLKYSLAFKQDGMKLVLEKGYSRRQSADHLGVSQSSLGRWVKSRM